MRERLVILSPHRDDAPFSLSCSLLHWRSLRVQISVINFFTQTQYAPHSPAENRLPPSLVRRREDHFVLRRLDPTIQIRDENFLDAPLRLGISPLTVCNPETAALLDEHLVLQIAACIRRFPPSLCLAPLGLGGHVDHLVVHTAALRAVPAHRLGFYEDLPYVTWTPVPVSSLAVRLKPVFCGHRYRWSEKRRAIGHYRSQITLEEAAGIARWAREHRGERIWVPRRSTRWSAFFQEKAQNGRGFERATQSASELLS